MVPHQRFRVLPVAAAALILLAACGASTRQSAAPATTAPVTEAAVTAAAVASPAEALPVAAASAPAVEAASVAVPAAVPTDWLTTVTVEGDYYVLGNPAAPVRLVDYSDFF